MPPPCVCVYAQSCVAVAAARCTHWNPFNYRQPPPLLRRRRRPNPRRLDSPPTTRREAATRSGNMATSIFVEKLKCDVGGGEGDLFSPASWVAAAAASADKKAFSSPCLCVCTKLSARRRRRRCLRQRFNFSPTSGRTSENKRGRRRLRPFVA